MSLVLAFSIMISVCVISGFSFNVSAATSNGQKIYINTNQNSTWKSIPQLKVRMTDAAGTQLSNEYISSTDRVFAATAPNGATRVEIASAPFTLPDTVVPNGKNRIIYKSPYGANTRVHYYGSPTEVGTEWPGQQMTQIGSSQYYYIDIDDSYTKLNFNNGQAGEGNQTNDLTINFTYSSDYAYYNGSNWANPYVKVIDLADITTGVDTEYYLLADGSFEKSKYLSTVAADMQNVTYKTVYVMNDKWTGINTLYATFDYSENYRGTLQLTATTTANGVRVFQGTIPANASVKFHPNRDNVVGASSTTMYPTGNSYDGANYNENTATYKITSNYEAWAKLSEINNITYDSVVGSRFHESSNILGVDATYFDYISDVEMSSGYLNNQDNYNNDYNGRWFPFSNFNRYISGIASSQNAWQYPLYFGNLYSGGNQFGYSDEVNGLSKYNDGDSRYAINNSNGLGNMYQSIQGLVYDRLDSNGNLQVANGVIAPYFDANTLSSATYNGNRVAKVFKSSFPFRSSTSGSVTTYEFDSTDAKDNVYFTWDGTTPKYVNYGGGWQYQVWDANYAFGGSSNGKGIFPFNNSDGADGTANTWHQTVDGVTYSRGGNNNLDFGFGIRLDIDFRVPKYGTLNGTTSGTPVDFNYTGDDDLWVFIGEEENGADAELVLDLGGDHKKATGSIDFKTMTATANDVFANFGNSSSSSEVTVPSDELWIKSGNYTDFCLHVWQDTDVDGIIQNNERYYIQPYETSDGFYKFSENQLGDNTSADFCQWQNVNDGKLGYVETLVFGSAYNSDGTPYSGESSVPTNLGTQTKRFGQGYGVNLGMSDSSGSYKSLDPNKVYHMTVFYMERGLSESNFSVGFTMTPANNELEVSKELKTGDVIPAIANALKTNEEFSFDIDDNNSSTTADTDFVLKHDGIKNFNNVFSTGSTVNVNETFVNNALQYNTNWELYDGELGTVINSSTGTATQFKLEDLQDTNSLIDLDLKYVNTIKTNDLEISKKVFDEDGVTDYETAQRFTFQMMIDLDGNGNKYAPTAYPLEYVSDGETLRMAADGSFTLGKDETIVVQNIPVGATYTLKELPVKGFAPHTISVDNGSATTFNGTYEAVMGSNVGAKLEIVNVTAPINAVVAVNKTLDGSNYNGELFTYTIRGLASMPTQYTDNGTVINSISAAGQTETITKPTDGEVAFKNAVNLVEPGYYRYVVTETFASSVSDAQKNDIKMDTATILVEVDNTGDTPNATYYKVDNMPTINSDADYASLFNNNTFADSASNKTFNNLTQKAMITVNKKNQATEDIAGTVFALVKISDDIYTAGTDADTSNDLMTGDVLKQIIASNANMIKGTTDTNGNVYFEDLLIYENGSGQFISANNSVVWNSVSNNYLNSTPNYQSYCIFEYSPADGYNPTNKVQYVQFPVDGYYDVTFDYVDGLIVTPNTSGSGMQLFFAIGLGIFVIGAGLATAYTAYDKAQRKRRKALATVECE